jgi:hypothetical protein
MMIMNDGDNDDDSDDDNDEMIVAYDNYNG